MSELAAPRPVHVERTPDPCVLRWVCHDSPVRRSPPGPRRPEPGSGMANLADEGVVAGVWVHDGDVHVRLGGPADRALAQRVDAAVTAALAADAAWLLRPSGTLPLPGLADLQAAVDRAAGEVTELHGGRLLVVGADDTAVTLRAEGACHGCRLSSSTIDERVAPALRAIAPTLRAVVLEPVGHEPRLRFRRPRRAG